MSEWLNRRPAFQAAPNQRRRALWVSASGRLRALRGKYATLTEREQEFEASKDRIQRMRLEAWKEVQGGDRPKGLAILIKLEERVVAMQRMHIESGHEQSGD